MESNKKMQLIGFVLLAAFALPALASSFEKDVISPHAIQAVLEKRGFSKLEDDPVVSALARTKTIISNPVIEEALLNGTNLKAGNGIPCAESCVWIPCTVTALVGCSCSDKVCYNSLQTKY
uniref:Cyclotide 4b n=1 Tax=Viola baoshanensis TaxID=349688 RepID=B5B3Z0_9ROSI|nr:cyclotide precursor 4b [Viola baoshanensis]